MLLMPQYRNARLMKMHSFYFLLFFFFFTAQYNRILAHFISFFFDKKSRKGKKQSSLSKWRVKSYKFLFFIRKYCSETKKKVEQKGSKCKRSRKKNTKILVYIANM